MRKRVITPNASASSQAWLDVESAAVVEVTSEGGAYPIDSALAITRETWLVSGEAGISDDPAYQQAQRICSSCFTTFADATSTTCKAVSRSAHASGKFVNRESREGNHPRSESEAQSH